MDLSIIIVNWNVKALLAKCLDSIYKQTSGLDFEVWVVDNASNDGSVTMVEKKYPQVKLIANRKNLGFARANNQAIKQASGDFILLLNPDTEILDQALSKMVKFMKANPRAGIAGCRLLNPDGTLQPSVRKFPDLLASTMVSLKMHHLKPFINLLGKYLAQDFDYSKTQSVKQVMGAFFMIRREVIKKIGLLDEGYYIWFEEVDYCTRLLKQTNFLVYYTPEAEIIHYGSQSFQQVLSLKKQWHFNQSQLRYYRLHKNWWQFMILAILNPISLFLALLVSILIPRPKKS